VVDRRGFLVVVEVAAADPVELRAGGEQDGRRRSLRRSLLQVDRRGEFAADVALQRRGDRSWIQ
jgi:hypothetical protein